MTFQDALGFCYFLARPSRPTNDLHSLPWNGQRSSGVRQIRPRTGEEDQFIQGPDLVLAYLLYWTLFVFTYIGHGLITDLMIRSRYRSHSACSSGNGNPASLRPNTSFVSAFWVSFARPFTLHKIPMTVMAKRTRCGSQGYGCARDRCQCGGVCSASNSSAFRSRSEGY